MEAEKQDGEVKIPHEDNDFLQQRWPGCEPFLRPLMASIIFFIFTLICLAIGIPFYISSKDMKQFEFDYTDLDFGNVSTTFKLDRDLKGDIWMFYKIRHFFQNNFVYSSSKSYDQLEGKSRAKANTRLCDSVRYADADKKKVYIPCGAVPMSIFNDTYTFDSNFPKIKTDSITPKYYRNAVHDIGEGYTDENSVKVIDETRFPGGMKNQNFINWLLISPFSTFIKTWGKLDTKELKKGDYQIQIENNYPVKPFDGKKSIVFIEVSWMGGANKGAGLFFIIVAIISFVCAIIFILLHILNCMPVYRAVVISHAAADLTNIH